MILIPYKLSQKLREGILHKSFQKASIIQIPKPDKDIMRKDNCMNKNKKVTWS